MIQMNIVFFGSGEFGIPCLDAIVKSKYSLTGIFTQPAHKAGRGQKLTPTPVGQWAVSKGLKYTEAENVNTEEMIEQVKSCKGDLLVVIAFGQKISQNIISLFDKGAINVHSSLLPKYRGAAPINWAIINGDTQTGVSIITLADRMDAGKILGQSQMEITYDTNAQQLHEKLSLLAVDLLMNVISQIENGTAKYQQQDESKVSLARKFNKSDGYIDWNLSADQIRNKIRGMWSWPGAQSFFVSGATGKSFRVIIAEAQLAEPIEKSRWQAAGVLNENLDVVCGQGCLKIIKIKPSGSGLMDFKSFINGRAVKPGDVFTSIEPTE